MKKQNKIKKSKGSPKRTKTPEAPVLPSLVEAMAKLVERMELLERKSDQILSRIGNLPSDIRNAVHNSGRPQSFNTYPSERPNAPQNETRNERVLYQAICADCQKNCEVPFKPGLRPVYCKECWAIRKAGHRSADPEQKSGVINPEKMKKYMPSPMDWTPPPRNKPSGTTTLKKKAKKKSKR